MKRDIFKLGLYVLGYIAIVKFPFVPLFAYFGYTDEFTPLYISIFLHLVAIAVGIYLIRKNKLYKNAGLKLSFVANPIFLVIPMFILAIILLPNPDKLKAAVTHPAIAILYFIATLAIGFAEEIYFRSFMQNYLFEKKGKSHKPSYILFVAALCFGIGHASNFYRLDILSLFNQIVFAVAIGFLFGCLLYRLRNIYLLAFLHGVIDFIYKINDRFNPHDTASNDTVKVIDLILSEIFTLGLCGIIALVGLFVLKIRFKKTLEVGKLNHAEINV